MKKSLLLLLCVFALFEAKAQNSSWMYDFGTATAAAYTSTTYSSTYLPAAMSGGGNAGVRASSATEGQIELTTAGLAGGTGAELKMTSGTTTSGAKFGLAPFTGTTVASFQFKINISSGTNGRFLLYFGNGNNFTSGSGISVPQTFASLRLSPTSTSVSLDWLSSATSPNYTTTGLSQTTINKNQEYTLKFFMNNSNNATSYTTGSGATLTTHNLAAGTFDVWLDNVKILINADPGTGLLPQGTIINGMNLLNVGAGSSAPVMYIDDISYTNFLIPTPPAPPATVTNTLVNVDYESGTENSGISNLNTTNATAEDAEYIVSPGRTGNYAIAHRVTIGDTGYFSDNHWRSEAATAQMFDTGKYYPGDERRFEASLLLKDWEPYTAGMAQNGDIIFQGKQSGGENPAWYLSAKRNSITFRIPNDNIEPTIIDDFRPYINQWIDFRVDAKMTTDATGYYKVYYRLPGQTEYTLAFQIINHRTFNQDIPETNPSGYLKWGLYRPGQSITTDPPNVATRIIYHDDIKIFELNNNSTPIALWNNSITDNNPAYVPAPYSPTNDVLAANVVSNSTSPSSDFSRSTLTPAGGATLSGRYLLGNWATGSAATPSPFDGSQYYEFKIAPKPGYQLTLKNMSFNWRTGGATNPNTYVLRSSLDNFTNNISAPLTVSDDTANTSNFGNSSIYDLANISTTSEITFRMYWYGATTAGSLVGIDNFTFNGNAYAVESNLQIQTKNNVTKNTDNAFCTYTTQGNEFDATATGNCGSITYSYVLSGATIASGTGTLTNKVFNKGETTVTWTATDGCNNSSTSFTIKVNDTEKPILTVPATITVNNDVNQCGAVVTLIQPTATDNCAVPNITNNAPALFPIGTTTVTWTATDANGNTATTTQTVIVSDTQAPTVNSNASVALCYEGSGNYSIPAATATDNCSVNLITYQITGATSRSGNGLDASGNFNVGLSTITWTVTDNAGNSSTTITTVTINSIISASVADVYAVSPGGKANTIYLGYGPSSLTLIATPANGTAPYTFSWSNGATTASIMVNPSTPGLHSYTATITDALGCYVTITKYITVTDILCADGKVKICHSSSPNHDKSLCISTSSVSDHLGHGCYLGTCENISTLSNRNTTLNAKQQINDFMVTVAPNPTKTEFRISVTGDPSQIIFVSIFDISGRAIKLLKTNSGQTITTGGELKPGMYLAEITQGMNKKTVKLIKQ